MARYLAVRAGDGASITTLRLAAIAKVHEWADHDSPYRDRGVREALKGWGRRLARPQRQAGALTADVLAMIRLTAPKPRARGRGFETAEQAAERARFDLTLVAVLSDGGLRLSEAAALTWGDVQRWDDGSGRITVARSKTDTEAHGAVVAITPTAMRGPGRRPDGVQGQRGEGIRVVGVPDRPADWEFFSGHSGRVGMTRRMAQNSAPTHEIKHHRLRLDRIHQNRYPVLQPCPAL